MLLSATRVSVVQWSVLCLLVALAVPLHAQVGGTAFANQVIIKDPFARALGEATVARRGYPGAAAINPASIGRPGIMQLSSIFTSGGVGDGGAALFRSAWLPRFDDERWVANSNVDVHLGRWTLAYRYDRLDLGDRELRDEQNNPRGTARDYQAAHGLTIARTLSPSFSAGVGVNYLRDLAGPATTVGSQSTNSTNSVSVDFGLLYTTRFTTLAGDFPLSVGWALTDLGPHIDYPDQPNRDSLPTIMRGGIGVGYATPPSWLNRPFLSIHLDLALSKTMVRLNRDEESGLAVPDAPLKALFTTWQPIEVLPSFFPSEPTRLSVANQLMRHRGFSVALLEVFAFRWGHFWEHELNGARQYRSYGWGLDLYYVTLDYSRVQDEDVTLAGTSFWRLGARVPLTADARADDPWRALWRLVRR